MKIMMIINVFALYVSSSRMLFRVHYFQALSSLILEQVLDIDEREVT